MAAEGVGPSCRISQTAPVGAHEVAERERARFLVRYLTSPAHAQCRWPLFRKPEFCQPAARGRRVARRAVRELGRARLVRRVLCVGEVRGRLFVWTGGEGRGLCRPVSRLAFWGARVMRGGDGSDFFRLRPDIGSDIRCKGGGVRSNIFQSSVMCASACQRAVMAIRRCVGALKSPTGAGPWGGGRASCASRRSTSLSLGAATGLQAQKWVNARPRRRPERAQDATPRLDPPPHPRRSRRGCGGRVPRT